MKPINKFKTYKYDAAPFFFFIDIYPPDPSNFIKPHLKALVNSKEVQSNPVMALPMRVDRVFNGESSIIIRPREPISFPVSDNLIAMINPTPFLQFGIEKLLYFTEIRGREQLYLSITPKSTHKWWNSTRFLYGNLFTLEGDFSTFLRAYLDKMINAYNNGEDLINAAKEYCQTIAELCEKRMTQNSVLVEMQGRQTNAELYKEKEAIVYKKFKKITQTQYHPELIDIEVFNLSERGFSEEKDNRLDIIKDLNPKNIKYIPLLIYDDLLECMLQNLKRLEENNDNLLDPSFLLDNNIILLSKPKESEDFKFSWWHNFKNIDLDSILSSIKANLEDYMLSLKENRI